MDFNGGDDIVEGSPDPPVSLQAWVVRHTGSVIIVLVIFFIFVVLPVMGPYTFFRILEKLRIVSFDWSGKDDHEEEKEEKEETTNNTKTKSKEE
uniref:Uncharacterized protein n=1 Tax=Romanomermis culicivorax TaxID=13658 RepID=A0A915JP39_ROMCU